MGFPTCWIPALNKIFRADAVIYSTASASLLNCELILLSECVAPDGWIFLINEQNPLDLEYLIK